MKRFLFSLFWLVGDLQPALSAGLKDTPTLGSKNTPRLLSKDILSVGLEYQINQNHSVLFYEEGSDELYLGGNDFILKLNVDDFHVIEKFHLNATGQEECQEDPCENVITIIEKFQNNLFVCGTNGQKPECWQLRPSVNNQSLEIFDSRDGTGISPFTSTQNSLSLTVEGDLYAAAPLDADGSTLQFRRQAGHRTNVWMYDSWVSEPTFVSASWVQRKDDPDNEKIYVFFREKNSDHNREADPLISRVARVCKVDEGGSKRFFQNMWTSFLKARLVCGIPKESLYFNRLQDVYVMHADNWQDTRVYALFTSNWNSTAVCIYTIKMIENIFENSKFKGYNNNVPTPRPGTCSTNSKALPRHTVNIVKDHSEMADWVDSDPFYISTNNYTKIVVDRVQAADQRFYNILLLATDSGKIHKVLESGSEPFIISETQLSNSSIIQSMKLDSKKKTLIVGSAERITAVNLQSCQEYSKSCEECVLARDPYCAWTNDGCTSTVPGSIQNIVDGKTNVCSLTVKEPRNRTKREIPPLSSVHLRTVHSVPQGVPFYLSCPIDSYHAEYTWEQKGQKSPCLQMLTNCLHLIPSMSQEKYGTYRCISEEKDYIKVVGTYELIENQDPKKCSKSNTPDNWNAAPALIPEMTWITLLVAIISF